MGKKILFLICLGFLAGCASQDDVLLLNNRLSALMEKQAVLQSRLIELEAETGSSVSRSRKVESLLDSYSKARQKEDLKLREQAAEIRAELERVADGQKAIIGRIEETEFLLKQKMESLSDRDLKIEARMNRFEESLTDLSKRIIRAEDYLGFEPMVQADSNVLVVNPSAEKIEDLSEGELYARAKKAYDTQDFETALGYFQEFIKKFPKSNVADNAQFWIGEIYYQEKWYEKAILEYQKVIEGYPKGNKVPAALLKQGLAFYRLKDKINGRLILNELVKKFPKSPEAKIARKKLAK